MRLTAQDALRLLQYLAGQTHVEEIHFLWRPFLPDPDDDLVLELAFAANHRDIITDNQKDFRGFARAGCYNDLAGRVPEVDPVHSMSTLTIQLPESLRKRIEAPASQERYTVSQFLASAAGEKPAVVLTTDYLRREAAAGRREDSTSTSPSPRNTTASAEGHLRRAWSGIA